jgi:hypothetical protein
MPIDVPIARAESLAIAQMWAELLDDEGISCNVVPAGVGDTTLVPGGQTAWEVRVAPSDAVRAREILPSDPGPAAPSEEEEQAADSASMKQAVRWLIIALAVFIALLLLLLGARSFG